MTDGSQNVTASVVGVGPIGYDDIETPHGSYRRLLGGSAVFFGLAAALFAPTRIVSAVGHDLAQGDLDLLARRGIDVTGIVRLEGSTHHWSARYSADLSQAETLVNDLGVMEAWRPVLPPMTEGDVLYIGSLDPVVQRDLARRAPADVFSVCDTQSHWIARDREAVLEACTSCAMTCVNENEIVSMTGAATARDAAVSLLALGSDAVVVKAGTRGATLFYRDGVATCPTAPAKRIEDPTGAGDAFAGGMLGRLAELRRFDQSALADALVYGVACASLVAERPAGQRVTGWSLHAVRDRHDELRGLMSVR